MSFVEVYKTKRYHLFKRINEAGFVCKLSMAFLFACLTGVGAMIRIYLPFTPVPLTLQVFFVLLSGVVLGKYYGGLSQAVYAGFGLLGVPWFTSPSALFGVTGGYIIGFIFASMAVGWVNEKMKIKRLPYAFIPMLLGVGIIYAFGSLQFSLVMHTSMYETMMMAVVPFIALDTIKAFGASLATFIIMPEK
ncbi:MAG: biotin transporter BioY [Candidatus Thermoplasmatota archaeon]|nr:biotin transporter BioY [Candidatus Thermoplasmatota archaeon]